MKAEDVRQIAAWLQDAGIAAFSLETPQGSLHLELDPGALPPAAAPPVPAAQRDGACITARGTGVFLATHPWHGAPLAEPGARVEAGQVVALLQSGRLYQPVTAPARGVLGHCLEPPGTLVDFGRPLLAFHPDIVDATGSNR
ncbi:MAG TPA: acetyl-CoA carboxylase biotin carboxyl carrier protein subunit [Roseomonas sp.]|jgi:biotin carboxyl carrier protein